MSQQKENRISFKFDKIYIPLINLNEYIIDLSYEDKSIRFHYPQKEAQIVSLGDITSVDRELIKMTIMTIVGKKYKKLAKGDFTVFQKSFGAERKAQQKTIELTLFSKHFESMGHKIEIINGERNSGKIQMEYICLDTISQKIGKESSQNKQSQLKKSKSKTANELNKLDELEIDLKREELFDDDLSDHSISIIDPADYEDNNTPLMEIASGDNVEQFNQLFNANNDYLLPKDPNQLKELNHILYIESKKLTDEYEKSLTAINNTNERIRVQAKNCYEKYKETKKVLYKERIALKEKTMSINESVEANQFNYNKHMEEVRGYKNEFNYLARQINNNTTVAPQIGDASAMTDILKNMHHLGFDIFVGLSEEQKKELINLVDVKEQELPQKSEEKEYQNIKNQSEEAPQNMQEEDLQNMKEDIELGNTIVSLIEKVANELFPNNVIGNVRIDQINAITYKFDDDDRSKEVTLKIGVNDELITDANESFVSWLIKHFGKKSK